MKSFSGKATKKLQRILVAKVLRNLPGIVLLLREASVPSHAALGVHRGTEGDFLSVL